VAIDWLWRRLAVPVVDEIHPDRPQPVPAIWLITHVPQRLAIQVERDLGQEIGTVSATSHLRASRTC